MSTEERRIFIMGYRTPIDPWPEDDMFKDVDMNDDPVLFRMPPHVFVDKMASDHIKASRKGKTTIFSIAKLSTALPTERTYCSPHHIVCSNRNVPTYRLVENDRHMPNMSTAVKRSQVLSKAGSLHSVSGYYALLHTCSSRT